MHTRGKQAQRALYVRARTLQSLLLRKPQARPPPLRAFHCALRGLLPSLPRACGAGIWGCLRAVAARQACAPPPPSHRKGATASRSRARFMPLAHLQPLSARARAAERSRLSSVRRGVRCEGFRPAGVAQLRAAPRWRLVGCGLCWQAWGRPAHEGTRPGRHTRQTFRRGGAG